MPRLIEKTRAFVAAGGHLAVARAVLGAYLFAHYAALVPYAAETFGRGGVLPQVALNPAYPHGLTLLGWLDHPRFIEGFVAALAALSLAYLAGFRTRTSAVLLFLGSHQLFHRNELTLNPSLPFLGFLLLAHAFFPADPPWSIDRYVACRAGGPSGGGREGQSAIPRDTLAVLWIVMAVAYSYSGWTKLVSPGWRSGEALSLLLASPLARDTALVRFMEGLPAGILAGFTWAALLAELLFAPLALSRRLRPHLSIALVAMHVGLVVLLDFADISLGMIAFHLFTIDPKWIGAPSHLSPQRGRFGDVGSNHDSELQRLPSCH
jgi:hypothetical protein